MTKIKYTKERCLSRAPKEPDFINSGDWPTFVSSTPCEPDKFSSNAEWPDPVCGMTRPALSKDTHQTREQAQAVCDRLESHGFGGNGEIFPVRTWVEEITTDTTEVENG